MKLVDIIPNVMVPTWSNERCGGVGLAQWLNRFFLDKDLCEDFRKYRSWSYSIRNYIIRLSSFRLILIKKIVKCPFKFNLVWLEETSFYEFFKEKSINMSKVSYSSMMYGLITKLSRIKEDVQKWENIKQDKSQRI